MGIAGRARGELLNNVALNNLCTVGHGRRTCLSRRADAAALSVEMMMAASMCCEMWRGVACTASIASVKTLLSVQRIHVPPTVRCTGKPVGC